MRNFKMHLEGTMHFGYGPEDRVERGQQGRDVRAPQGVRRDVQRPERREGRPRRDLRRARRDAAADDVPAMASAMGTVGVDDEGERDASLDELFWLGLEPDFDGKYTLEVEEDEAAGLGVETRDGPLVLGENPNGGGALPVGDAGARKEGCSCIYGNPCQDKYVCLNWNGRFEVAKKNGWKGF